MKYLSILFLLCLFSLSIRADELRGRVVGVTDGDTLTVLDAVKTQHKIRINGIDAPELGQDLGEASKQNLSFLAFNKDVVVVWSKRDKYGRLVGVVIQGALDLGLTQIRDGFAWYYRQYESDVPPVERVLYDAAERSSRSQLRGLWKQPGARPPWEVRHPEQVTPGAPVAAPGNNQVTVYMSPNGLFYHYNENCPLLLPTTKKSYALSEAIYRGHVCTRCQASAPLSIPKVDSSLPSTPNPPPEPSPLPSKAATSSARSSAPTYRTESYRTYYRGPRGGCYYINGNGNKTYVDRSMCN